MTSSDDASLGVFEQLGRIGFVPIVTVDEPDRAVAVGRALLAGGLPCMEITFRVPGAADAIAAVSDALPELIVGAGTVLTPDQADAARAGGARFAVTPGFDDAVVDRFDELGVPVAPGVMTPTEINRALARGLRTVKFFPAEAAGGVAALRAIAAPYAGLTFMPTGGIDIDNVGDYLRLPAVLACGGSSVAPTEAIARGEFDDIERRAAEIVAVVRSVRG